ncbi:MAG: hypothetical protein KIT72_00245 [Polyangiaceae bacterium]|nr:hypothetical protein [Polyangiaceae bacterium]MCW5788825.1 hypothetical protein [Polyangiaceae bacterium]
MRQRVRRWWLGVAVGWAAVSCVPAGKQRAPAAEPAPTRSGEGAPQVNDSETGAKSSVIEADARGATQGGADQPPKKSEDSRLIPGAGSFVTLAVPEFPSAVLWVPRAAPPRPLLVATHGATGRPEPHCERWQQLVGDRAFVLCVRGAPTNRRDPPDVSQHYYPDHRWLGRAVKANLRALEEAYAEHVDLEQAVYAGYSQGAVMGALMLMEHQAPFARALLIEGQQDDWSVSAAERFVRKGGDRVALVCGFGRCAEAYARSERTLRKGGVKARFEHAEGAGHTYGGAVGERVAESLVWLVAEDPRWR